MKKAMFSREALLSLSVLLAGSLASTFIVDIYYHAGTHTRLITTEGYSISNFIDCMSFFILGEIHGKRWSGGV